MIPPRPRDMNRGQMPGAWWTNRDGTHLARRLFRLLTLQRVPLTPFLLALWRGRQLVRTLGPNGRARGQEAIAVVTYRGEASLLPAFLAHHRALLIVEFIFLDLSPDGHLATTIGCEADCVVWRPRRPQPSRVTSWSDFLRHRYARGRWCISLEASDFLVFFRCETRSIASFTDFLKTEHRDHAFAVVIEMYGDRPSAQIALAPGESPFDVAPFFDAFGYLTAQPAEDGSVPTRGGVRRRTLFKAFPEKAPRLDRVPIVRWRRRFTYVDGTSVLRPRRLNTSHARWHSSPTVCLLRFSLLVPGDGDDGLRQRMLVTNASRCYTSSEDLVDCGMLNPGQWF